MNHLIPVLEPSLALIIDVVADEFGVTRRDIVSERRDVQTCLARNVAMFIARELTTKAPATIGAVIGERSPQTVSLAVNQVRARMANREEFKHRVLMVMDSLMRPAPFTVITTGAVAA